MARHLALRRSASLPEIPITTTEPLDLNHAGLTEAVPLLASGRLLVWHRDDTVDDGVGEQLTAGYLDQSDMPPWDTWVAYVDSEQCSGYLLAWVPPPFCEAVDRAVAANAYGALYWLRGSARHLAGLLNAERLLY